MIASNKILPSAIFLCALLLHPSAKGDTPSPGLLESPSLQDMPFEGDSLRSGAIKSEVLKAPDINAIGILDDAKGGLGIGMWEGTDPLLVQRLLPALPAMQSSRTVRSLARRLLLTSADAPSSLSRSAAPVPLLRLRAEKLFAMGESEGLLQLLQTLPAPAFSPDLRRLKIDVLLAENAIPAACDEVNQIKAASDPYFNRVRVFCHLAMGRGSEAALGLEVLREQGQSEPVLENVAEALLNRPAAEMQKIPQINALGLALLRLAKKPLPPEMAQVESPLLLKAISLYDGAALETRLAAAEKAESWGNLDTEIVRQLYASVSFTEQELQIPLSADKGSRSRALLYRAAQLQTSNTARAELITRALSLGREQGLYFTTARVYGPIIASLKLSPDLAPFSGHFARALFASGQTNAARSWLALARAQSATYPEAATAAARLWPLLRLSEADDGKPLSRIALSAWRKANADGGAEQSERRAAIVYGIFEAIGYEVGTDEWLSLVADNTTVSAIVPRPALWHALRIAADKLRLAETVMIALVTLGNVGPGGLEPTSLYRVIASLNMIGLEKEARSLAIETLIANGL